MSINYLEEKIQKLSSIYTIRLFEYLTIVAT